MKISGIWDAVPGKSRAERALWGVAFLATLLLPWMLIFSRAGTEICAILIGLLFLAQAVYRRQTDWLHDPFMQCALLAWLWMLVIVSPLAVNPSQSLYYAATWVRFPLLYAALRYWVLTRPQSFRWLSVNLSILLGFTLIDTLWQFASGTSLTGHVRNINNRLSGPFESIKVGIFLAKLLLPTLAIFLVFAKQSGRVLIPAAIAFFFVTIVTITLSGERTALASTLLGGVTTLVLLMYSERNWRKPGVAIIICAIVLLLFLLFTQDWVMVRADQLYGILTDYGDSNYGKLAQAGIAIGEQHWLHGVGLNRFRSMCPTLFGNAPDACGLHPHNIYLEWFAETGLPGLVLLLVMLAVLARETWGCYRKQNPSNRLLPAFCAGILVLHFFPFMATQSFFSNWPGLLMWYSFSIVFAALRTTSDRK